MFFPFHFVSRDHHLKSTGTAAYVRDSLPSGKLTAVFECTKGGRGGGGEDSHASHSIEAGETPTPPTLDVVEDLPDGHLLHLVGPVLPQLEQHVLVPLLLEPPPEQLVALRPRPLPRRTPPIPGTPPADRHVLRRDSAADRRRKPRLR